MKFILESTSGRMYDIPTTTETITKVLNVRGKEISTERKCAVCEVNTLEDLMDMVDRINTESDFFPDISHPLNGREYEVTYVLSGWGLSDGYVALGIVPRRADV